MSFFWQSCLVIIHIHHNWHACSVLFKRMRQFCDVCASFANVYAFFLTCLCVRTWHIRRYSDKDVYVIRIYHNWHACMVLFQRMRQFCDVCASFANVCAVFLMFLCVPTWHIRRFSDKYVCTSYAYITIDTHASYFFSTCVPLVMYVLLQLTFVVLWF